MSAVVMWILVGPKLSVDVTTGLWLVGWGSKIDASIPWYENYQKYQLHNNLNWEKHLNNYLGILNEHRTCCCQKQGPHGWPSAELLHRTSKLHMLKFLNIGQTLLFLGIETNLKLRLQLNYKLNLRMSVCFFIYNVLKLLLTYRKNYLLRYLWKETGTSSEFRSELSFWHWFKLESELWNALYILHLLTGYRNSYFTGHILTLLPEWKKAAARMCSPCKLVCNSSVQSFRMCSLHL